MADSQGSASIGGILHWARKILSGIDRGTEFIETVVLGTGVLGMAGLLISNVITRNIFGFSVRGVFELTQILIVVVTFIGLGYGFRKARHISMSALYDQLSGTLRKAALVTIMIVTGGLMFYLATIGLDYVQSAYNRGSQTTAYSIPWWTVYTVAPLGFALAGIQLWLAAFRNLTTEGIFRSFTEREQYDETDLPSGP
jgi:C4-dicarboxylate transporter, DctQ subunit